MNDSDAHRPTQRNRLTAAIPSALLLPMMTCETLTTDLGSRDRRRRRITFSAGTLDPFDGESSTLFHGVRASRTSYAKGRRERDAKRRNATGGTRGSADEQPDLEYRFMSR